MYSGRVKARAANLVKGRLGDSGKNALLKSAKIKLIMLTNDAHNSMNSARQKFIKMNSKDALGPQKKTKDLLIETLKDITVSRKKIHLARNELVHINKLLGENMFSRMKTKRSSGIILVYDEVKNRLVSSIGVLKKMNKMYFSYCKNRAVPSNEFDIMAKKQVKSLNDDLLIVRRMFILEKQILAKEYGIK